MHSNQENKREGPKSSTKKNGPIQLRSDAKFDAMHATESHVILWAFPCIQKDKMRILWTKQQDLENTIHYISFVYIN